MQVVVGMGEIGSAVAKLLHHMGRHVTTYDLTYDSFSTLTSCDALHICFPYTDSFVESVKGYIKIYNPRHIIIYSTVAIGTTEKIKGAVHSPVEGKHPNLFDSLLLMTRFIGASEKKEFQYFANLFADANIRSMYIESPSYTEALKLLSTSEYGLNIAFARYKKEVAEKLGMDYQLMKDWNTEYNNLYADLGLDDKFKKYVLDAPEGPIGGHCVVPNAEILNKQFPSKLLKEIK